jgi:hypothetical protein
MSADSGTVLTMIRTPQSQTAWKIVFVYIYMSLLNQYTRRIS